MDKTSNQTVAQIISAQMRNADQRQSIYAGPDGILARLRAKTAREQDIPPGQSIEHDRT